MPIVIKYNLDLTGTNPNNLVQGEQITLPNNRIRCIAPAHGCFFGDSVVLRDALTNAILQRDVDWYPAELEDIITAQTGKPIYALIIIPNPNVSAALTLDYQAVGGDYSASITALANIINTLNLDARPVNWPDLLNRPTAYPPSQHLHDAGDIYGFEYLVHALERLADAIGFGDALAQQSTLQYVDAKFSTAMTAIGAATEVTLDISYWNNGNGY